MSKIIDNTLYFPLGSASLTTPQKFNAIFDSVNDNALGKHNYIPTTEIGVSTNFLFYEAPDNVSPMTVTMADVTPLPVDWVISSVTWTLMSDGSAGGSDGYQPSSLSTNPLTLTLTTGDTPGVIDSNHVLVKLEVDYTHPTLGTGGTSVTVSRIAYAGMPFAKRGLAGEDAIQAPQALIYCNAPHQNASFPAGHIIWEALSRSFKVQSTSLTYVWKLEHVDSDGALVADYSNTWLYSDTAHTSLSTTSANVYVKSSFGHENKRFRLTLEITDNSSPTPMTDTTSVELFSYNHGTFFYSWDATTVQAPDAVTLTTSDFNTASDFFLPSPAGAAKVKWGKDFDDIATSGNVSCASGSDAELGGTAAIQGVLDAALPGADALQYSLLNTGIVSEAGDMINKYFWVHPMASSAKIIKKLSTVEIDAGIAATGGGTQFDAAFGGASIVTNASNIYLLQGTTTAGNYTSGNNPGMSIGPDAEKYFVYLTEWSSDGNTYLGTRDQSAVVVSKGSAGSSAAPAVTDYSFTNVYNDGYYKAEVVASKMGSYSSKVVSGAVTFSGGGPHTISSVDVAHQGSCSLTLKVNHTEDNNAPVGYLVSYKEVAVTSTQGTSGQFALFNPDQDEYTVFFTNSKAPRLVGNIGKKLIGEVKAVAPNGSMGASVLFPATSIIVDSALDQTGLSKHLGTRYVALSSSSGDFDESIPSELSPQKQWNVFSTVFGRDVYLEQLNVWCHKAEDTYSSNTNDAGIFSVQVQVTGQEDHKEIIIDPASDLDTLKTNGDLSIPIPAGKEVIICVYDHLGATADDVTNLLQNGYELSCEIFYAHAATGDGGTGGSGTA